MVEKKSVLQGLATGHRTVTKNYETLGLALFLETLLQVSLEKVRGLFCVWVDRINREPSFDPSCDPQIKGLFE
jgi:hypothetical protein